MEYIPLLLLGVALIVISVQNFKGNISTVKRYNRRKVSEADAPKYGKAMGLGTLIMGASIVLTAVLQMIFDREPIFYVLAAGVLLGLAVMICAQFKYNKGIF